MIIVDGRGLLGRLSSLETSCLNPVLHPAGARRLSCPATDFEQVCGAAHAALRISRVVSDVVRAYGVAGGRYG